MRDASPNIRDLALIDLLASTGMRVGEVTLLNRSDIDFENRECIVLGKGGKETDGLLRCADKDSS